MQEELKPTFVKQIQKAVDQGQVVLIHAPPSQRPAPTPHNIDEASLTAALCLLFKLRHSEGRMLIKLLAHNYSSKEDLRVAAARDQEITLGTTSTFLSSLRKKLAAHNIRIATIPTLGYGVDAKARDKIRALLIEYDAGILSTRSRSKSKTPEGDLFPTS